MKEFDEVVQVEKPLGIYISNQYLWNKPRFMARLNQAIGQVVHGNHEK